MRLVTRDARALGNFFHPPWQAVSLRPQKRAGKQRASGSSGPPILRVLAAVQGVLDALETLLHPVRMSTDFGDLRL